MSRLGPDIGSIRISAPSHPDGRQLLPGEHILVQYGVLLLTSHRVQLTTTDSASSSYLSLTLDAVASCGLVSHSQPLLLVLAVLSALVGGATKMTGMSGANMYVVGGLMLGAVLVVAFMLGRRTTISIRAMNGESLTAEVGHTNRGPLLNFLDAIELAKLRAIGRIGDPTLDTSDGDDLPPPPAAKKTSGSQP